MSHGKLRKDTNCLNCNHTVSERFCPNCGQENIETKQSAHHLIVHFFEDFTHYDTGFWKSIIYLLFKPGKLTNEYLAGKRQLYVAPVKLYIFISFITFLSASLLGGSSHNDTPNNHKVQITKTYTSINFDKDFDQLLNARDLPQLDSIIASSPQYHTLGYQILKPAIKRYVYLKSQHYSNKEIFNKFTETFVHTLPKALFLYMPIFAFILWLFHNKKKWWFFEHGIFTLHYFSFLLLSVLLLTFSNALTGWINANWFSILYLLAIISGFIYSIRYFFIASRKVYDHSKKRNLLKGILIMLINSLFMTLHLLILVYISLLILH